MKAQLLSILKSIRVFYVAGTLILAGLLLAVLTSRKTVTVDVDGESQSVTTTALTAKGALRSAGLPLQAEDKVYPAAGSWLQDGQVVEVARAARVQISADGETYTLFTAERHPANLLALAEVRLYPGDRLLVNGQWHSPDEPLAYAPVYFLELRRAVPVIVQDGGTRFAFSSAATTLGEALWEAGITLYAGDQLTPSVDTPLDGEVHATLKRARQIEVTLGDQVITARSAATTVGQALNEVGFPLQGLDYSLPAEDEPLPEDGRIQVVRVVEELVLEQEPLPFTTLTQPVADLEIDNYQVIQPGEYGLQAQRVRVRYEDGVEVSRAVEGEWVAREPVPRIEGYGTNIIIRTANTANGPIEYWRAVEVYATSYSPANSSGVPGVVYPYTSSGKLVKEGMIAVRLSWYYYMKGQAVYVPDYGFATVEDVGTYPPDNRHWIDLAYSDANYVGRYYWTTLYFLTPVPPADQILWILP